MSLQENFTTSLGAGQSIRITSHPLAIAHGTKSSMLSKSSLVTYTHSFEVKNTRQDAVQLQISEQVPLTTDDRIKVRVREETHVTVLYSLSLLYVVAV